MGIWGSGLYAGDFAADLRAAVGAVARLPFDGDRLVEILSEVEPDASRNPADEDHITFWLVVADQFARRGIVSPHAQARALAIIDTAPHSDSAAAIAAQFADFVLIPCRPARFDLDAIATTAQIAKVAKTPAAVVLNAAQRGKLVEEARAALQGQSLTVMDTVLYQRAAYSHAVIDGCSVHEYEPEGKAAAEIDELYNHESIPLSISRSRCGW